MAKDAPAYDWYPERFWFAVEGWTDREIVAYKRLLDQQWMRDGLPESIKELEGLARGKISPRVIQKFPLAEEGVRRNPYMESVRDLQRKRIDAARSKATAMNDARWGSRRSGVHKESTRSPQGVLKDILVDSPPLTTHLPPLNGSKAEREIQSAARTHAGATYAGAGACDSHARLDESLSPFNFDDVGPKTELSNFNAEAVSAPSPLSPPLRTGKIGPGANGSAVAPFDQSCREIVEAAGLRWRTLSNREMEEFRAWRHLLADEEQRAVIAAKAKAWREAEDGWRATKVNILAVAKNLGPIHDFEPGKQRGQAARTEDF